MATLPITNCPDGAGSINSQDATQPASYVSPELCVGTWQIPECPDIVQEQYAAENLNISGAPVTAFKLRR